MKAVKPKREMVKRGKGGSMLVRCFVLLWFSLFGSMAGVHQAAGPAIPIRCYIFARLVTAGVCAVTTTHARMNLMIVQLTWGALALLVSL